MSRERNDNFHQIDSNFKNYVVSNFIYAKLPFWQIYNFILNNCKVEFFEPETKTLICYNLKKGRQMNLYALLMLFKRIYDFDGLHYFCEVKCNLLKFKMYLGLLNEKIILGIPLFSEYIKDFIELAKMMNWYLDIKVLAPFGLAKQYERHIRENYLRQENL